MTEDHHDKCGCCSGATYGLETSLEEMGFQRSLQGAALAGDVARMRSLLLRGAQVTGLESDAYSPLHYAARNGHVDACRLLLQNKAQVDKPTRAGRATSLHKAAYGGHEDVVRLLLQYGAIPLCQDSDGCTPLHKAALQGHLGTVKLLLEACPEVLQVPDNHGRLPTDCASEQVAGYLHGKQDKRQ